MEKSWGRKEHFAVLQERPTTLKERVGGLRAPASREHPHKSRRSSRQTANPAGTTDQKSSDTASSTQRRQVPAAWFGLWLAVPGPRDWAFPHDSQDPTGVFHTLRRGAGILSASGACGIARRVEEGDWPGAYPGMEDLVAVQKP